MVRKAVIPAAGFGTRFLPVTKSQPKEMIPVVDMPVIHYVVKEAVDSGITDILMIIGRGKRAIEEYFDRSFELEQQLEEKGKKEKLKKIKAISELANIHFVWQKELNGLGDAVRYAQSHVGNEPFAVLLGDTIMESSTDIPVTKQLMNVFDRFNEPVVATQQVKKNEVSRYGILDGKEIEEGLLLTKDFIEKPKPKDAPTDMAITGRYIFTPEIFEYLANVKPGVNDEIQLTDAMRMMVKNRAMYALRYKGKRHDIGNKLEFIKANVHFGLQRKDIGGELKEWLTELAKSL